MTPLSPRDQAKGLALAVFGVLILTPDTLIMRLVGAEPWTTLFWRGVMMTVGFILLALIWYRGRAIAAVRAVGGIRVASLRRVDLQHRVFRDLDQRNIGRQHLDHRRLGAAIRGGDRHGRLG